MQDVRLTGAGQDTTKSGEPATSKVDEQVSAVALQASVASSVKDGGHHHRTTPRTVNHPAGCLKFGNGSIGCGNQVVTTEVLSWVRRTGSLKIAAVEFIKIYGQVNHRGNVILPHKKNAN